MLVEELKPFIDERYRTLAGSSNTGLGGSSLGGLATLYLGFTYPEIFGKLAVLSPSVWWDNQAILKIIGRSQPKPRLKIWLSMGTEESKNGLRDAESLRDAFGQGRVVLGLGPRLPVVRSAAPPALSSPGRPP